MASPRKLFSLGGGAWAYGDYKNAYGFSSNGLRSYIRSSDHAYIKLWINWRTFQDELSAPPADWQPMWDHLNNGPYNTPGVQPGVIKTLDQMIAAAQADGIGVILTVYHGFPWWTSDYAAYPNKTDNINYKLNDPNQQTLRAGKDPSQKLPDSVAIDGWYSYFIAYLISRYKPYVPANPIGPHSPGPGESSNAYYGNPYGAYINGLEIINEPNLTIWPQSNIHCAVASLWKNADTYAVNYGSATGILAPASSDLLMSDTPTHSPYQMTDYDVFTDNLVLALQNWHPGGYSAWSHHNYKDIANLATSRVARVWSSVLSNGFQGDRANLYLTEGGYRLSDDLYSSQFNQDNAMISGYNATKNQPYVTTYAQHIFQNGAWGSDNFQSGVLTSDGSQRPLYSGWAGLR